jgi:predicted HAD superfamily Cof-like phosphohydrolase
MKSHLQKILEFNKAFGVKTTNNPDLLSLYNSPLMDYRLNLILEEVEELKEALEKKDFKEVVDALADIEYVVLGMYTAIGVDGDKAFDIVHESNMSKLCFTQEEAQQTVKYYRENFEKHGYDSPCYRLSDDGVHYVVYNKSTSKILKNINYKPANFEEIL